MKYAIVFSVGILSCLGYVRLENGEITFYGVSETDTMFYAERHHMGDWTVNHELANFHCNSHGGVVVQGVTIYGDVQGLNFNGMSCGWDNSDRRL